MVTQVKGVGSTALNRIATDQVGKEPGGIVPEATRIGCDNRSAAGRRGRGRGRRRDTGWASTGDCIDAIDPPSSAEFR